MNEDTRNTLRKLLTEAHDADFTFSLDIVREGWNDVEGLVEDMNTLHKKAAVTFAALKKTTKKVIEEYGSKLSEKGVRDLDALEGKIYTANQAFEDDDGEVVLSHVSDALKDLDVLAQENLE